MRFAAEDSIGLLTALIGDGRPLLMLVALGLMLSGIFALFLSATGTFLPHDVSFLGMQPGALCDLHQCRVVHFIFHDRVSFGGTLMAIGALYLWLLAFPLRHGEEWAWWTLLLSGVVGFLSFLAYRIYGYLDSWHGVATAALLPLFVGGIWKSRGLLPAQREGWRSLLRPVMPMALGTRVGFGRACLLFVGAGMALAGSVITILGSTVVFVPQDITYLGFSAAQLNAINPHLVPLIAHDRAGFGGWSRLLWAYGDGDCVEGAADACAVAGAAGGRSDRVWLRDWCALPDGLPERVSSGAGVDGRGDLCGRDCVSVSCFAGGGEVGGCGFDRRGSDGWALSAALGSAGPGR